MAKEKKKDKLFRRKRHLVADFTFGKQTAAVFDDMLDRSVPFYGEIQRMIAEMAADLAVEGTNLYDLGCSMGNTFLAFKERQGYSKMEIAQKREALENVLVPYRLEENRELLLSGGFSQCDVFSNGTTSPGSSP